MRALLPLLLAACAARPVGEPPPAPPPPAPPEAPPERALTAAEEELELQRQYSQVMHDRHLALARRHRDRLELDEAFAEADAALRFRPASEEARRLRAEVGRLRGDRAAETETLLDTVWQEQEAKRQQRVVETRRALAAAEERMAVGDYDEARRHYERALFLAELDRATALRDEAEEGLRRLRDG